MIPTPEKQGRENFTEWCIAEYGEHYNDGCSCGDLPWKCWSAACQARDSEVEAMAKEVGRLREALKFYSNPGDYQSPFTGGMGKLYYDCGETARDALAQAKPTTEEGK